MRRYPDLIVDFYEHGGLWILYFGGKARAHVRALREIFEALASGSAKAGVLDSEFAELVSPLRHVTLTVTDSEGSFQSRRDDVGQAVSIEWTNSRDDWYTAVEMMDNLSEYPCHQYLPPDPPGFEIEFDYVGHLAADGRVAALSCPRGDA